MEAAEFVGLSISPTSPFKHKTLSLENGVPLNIYDTGMVDSGKTILMVNSLGFPAEFFEPFAELVKDDYRVITWDQRCMPGPGIQDFSTIGPITHAEDIIKIIDYLDINDFVILGYCNGCEVSLMASRLIDKSRLVHLILTNAHYSFREQRSHPNTHGLYEMFRDVAKNPEKAEKYYGILKIVATKGPVPNRISKYPFTQGADKLHRLSVMIENYENNNIEKWIGTVDAPCTSVVPLKDDVSDPLQSIQIIEYLKTSSKLELEDGDHYSLYLDSFFREAIVAEIEARYSIFRKGNS